MIPITEELRSILLGTAGLWVAAAVALALTLARDGIAADPARLRSAAHAGIIALLCQMAHFAEELATGFHRRFPTVLGLAPWSSRFFVWFNVAWLAIWALSLRGLVARRRIALFPLWFLALGAVANAVGHPALAVRAGGYFPGLVTAPLVGAAGVLLALALLRARDT